MLHIIQKELEHVDHRVAAPRYNGNCAYIEGLEETDRKEPTTEFV